MRAKSLTLCYMARTGAWVEQRLAWLTIDEQRWARDRWPTLVVQQNNQKNKQRRMSRAVEGCCVFSTPWLPLECDTSRNGVTKATHAHTHDRAQPRGK